MKTTITTRLLNTIQPKAKRYEIRDARLPGLILRVNPTGKLIYLCEFGRGKKITIGRADIITPAQAREQATKVLAQVAQGVDPREVKRAADKLTLQQFIEKEYGPWRIAHRKNGIRDIARLKRHFFTIIGKQQLSEIQALSIERWRSRRVNDGIHAETINRDINVLKAALSKAVEWNFIKEHPLAKVKPLKFDRSPNVRYLDQAEMQRLNHALQQRAIMRDKWLNRVKENPKLVDTSTSILQPDYLTPLIILSMNTGARRGELFTLKWQHVNVEKRTIGLLGKSQKLRYVPLNDEALVALQNWREQTQSTTLVFCKMDGSPLSTVRKEWLRILNDADIQDFRWHDMRHHFASWLVMSGVDLNTVRELLGHADIKMTLRYAHLAPEHKALAVSKLPPICPHYA